MEYQQKYKRIFSFDVEWNYPAIGLFVFLVAVPNLLGMLNISTPFGFKLHFFQLAVFIAAFTYGPLGGVVSGAIGSVYSAVLMNNPYIVVGNIILGLFAGMFFRLGMKPLVAVLIAYAIQLPWLWVSDIYLAHMPAFAVKGVIIALLISNTVWGLAAGELAKPLRKILN